MGNRADLRNIKRKQGNGSQSDDGGGGTGESHKQGYKMAMIFFTMLPAARGGIAAGTRTGKYGMERVCHLLCCKRAIASIYLVGYDASGLINIIPVRFHSL